VGRTLVLPGDPTGSFLVVKMEGTQSCETCHGTVVAADDSVVGPTHHVDGTDKRRIRPRRVEPDAGRGPSLAAARPVPAWRPPEGCERANDAGQTVTVRSEEQLRAIYVCPAGAVSGIDFAANHLVLADRMLSPAQIGSDIYDDGTTITFVSRQRTSCPDDPQPIPTPYTVAFLLPAGAERAYAEASCTVRQACK